MSPVYRYPTHFPISPLLKPKTSINMLGVGLGGTKEPGHGGWG